MKIKNIMPFIILFSLLGLLGYELFYAKPHEIPSPLIGEKIPNFKLPTLYQKEKSLTQKDLVGRVALLNVWATWCYACTLEEPMLRKINTEYHIPIYGMIYKDDANKAREWLEKNGNPYILIGDDRNGDVAIDFGVYGTPETFVISPSGKIIYRHVGVIDQQAWDEVIYPLVKQYAQK